MIMLAVVFESKQGKISKVSGTTLGWLVCFFKHILIIKYFWWVSLILYEICIWSGQVLIENLTWEGYTGPMFKFMIIRIFFNDSYGCSLFLFRNMFNLGFTILYAWSQWSAHILNKFLEIKQNLEMVENLRYQSTSKYCVEVLTFKSDMTVITMHRNALI